MTEEPVFDEARYFAESVIDLICRGLVVPVDEDGNIIELEEEG